LGGEDQPLNPNLEKLKQAIAQREGFAHIGSVPNRTNNPGDLIFVHQHGAKPYYVLGRDGIYRVYASFETSEEGWAALEAQIKLDAARGETLEQFIEKYSPASDGNDPESYLAFVMRELGIEDKTMKLTDVIG
jgi:hypothetical protein